MKEGMREWSGWLARHALYVAIVVAVYGAVWMDARGGRAPQPPTDERGIELPETGAERLARLQEVSQFNEDGVVESLELAILLAIAMGCGWCAVREREARPVLVLMGGVVGLAAIREQDQWFDQFAHGSWVVPAGLLAAGLAAYAWRRRRELGRGLGEIVRTPGWGLFVAGGLVSMVFSRLMGRKDVWNHLIEAPRLARNMKNMVEESLEVAGYALMLCALIEGMAQLRRRGAAGEGCNRCEGRSD